MSREVYSNEVQGLLKNLLDSQRFLNIKIGHIYRDAQWRSLSSDRLVNIFQLISITSNILTLFITL